MADQDTVTNRPAGQQGTRAACCDMMAAHIDQVCQDGHVDAHACPDATLVRTADGSVGIPVRDGGRSVISIDHCPWCTAALTPSGQVGCTPECSTCDALHLDRFSCQGCPCRPTEDDQ